MSKALNQSAFWKEEGGAHRLHCGALEARLSTAQPGQGIAQLTLAKQTLAGSLLAVTADEGPLPDPIESYLRGQDLVSTHPPNDRFPFRTQLYWSAFELSQAEGVAVTLSVSLQTHLLDTQPSLSITSSLGAAEPINPGLIRIDLPGSNAAFLAVHPSDVAETNHLSDGDRHTITLSPPMLEKGVIRRCRLAALLFPSSPTEQQLEAALERFASAPLPLTA